jgi:aspartyl-tRNA(Asn)/glutamyl-tRNA(Gln) amidotransferase subunit A
VCRVGRTGVVPLSWSLDHVGPLAQTVRDAALTLQAITGADPGDPASTGRPLPDLGDDVDLSTIRVGVPASSFVAPVEPDVAGAARAAVDVLAAAGAGVVEVELPMAELIAPTMLAICVPEASAFHRPAVLERGQLYGEATRALLEAGLTVPAVDLVRAQQVRQAITAAWRDALAGVDVLALPTTPAVAVDREQDAYPWPDGDPEPVLDLYMRLCLPASVTGRPALSVPCGVDAGGMPIGLQLIGQPYAEDVLVGIGAAYQAQTDWHAAIPALP